MKCVKPNPELDQMVEAQRGVALALFLHLWLRTASRLKLFQRGEGIPYPAIDEARLVCYPAKRIGL